jgi:hypothetical protein
MINPLDVWAPIFRAPFSGDVTQAISPRLFSPEIKGNREIEFKIETEVASFGKQLGKIIEALRALSDETGRPLPAIEEIYNEVEALKAEHKGRLREEAKDALDKLKEADKQAWQEVVRPGTVGGQCRRKWLIVTCRGQRCR